jgi:putative addiction module killer protein
MLLFAGKPKQLLFYADCHGREPFTIWFENLRDAEARIRIPSRLRRLEQGNYGDCKAIRKGICELRMFFGPGYRIYFGVEKNCIVVLLCGGKKNGQEKDIENALRYWEDYQEHS